MICGWNEAPKNKIKLKLINLFGGNSQNVTAVSAELLLTTTPF